MAQTQSSALSAALTFKVQTDALRNLRAALVFADPSMAQQGSMQGPGIDTILFVKYPDLAIASTPLTEGSAPSTTQLTQSVVAVDTNQYGASVDLSDIAKIKAPVELGNIASERLARQAAETIDKISRDEIVLGGTPYYVAGSSRSGLGAGDKVTASALMKLRAKMFASKVPMPDDGYYRLKVHPNVAYDIRADSTNPGGWLDVNRYALPETILKGEVGRIHGFRIQEVVNGPTFSSTTTVYASIATGAIKGWGAGELQSLQTFHVGMGGDHSDLLAQSELWGWKIDFGVAPLDNSYYFRLESAATSV